MIFSTPCSRKAHLCDQEHVSLPLRNRHLDLRCFDIVLIRRWRHLDGAWHLEGGVRALNRPIWELPAVKQVNSSW